MKNTNRYYIRIEYIHHAAFIDYLELNALTERAVVMTSDIKGRLYALSLNKDEASALRLSFDFIGFMNITKIIENCRTVPAKIA
jgi:hypothetical protein